MKTHYILDTSEFAHAHALREDTLLRGTGRAKERAFRETMRDFAKAYAETLLPILYVDVMDHLTRTDGDGHTLCFAGPERERMLSVLYAWLDIHDSRAAAALRQVLPETASAYNHG